MEGDEIKQAKFEGWAIVELMGHQTEIGFVTTENYGAASLFRIDRPPVDAREFVLERPEFVREDGQRDRRYCPIGTKVKRAAIPPKSRLVGAGSIYAINPCDSDAALAAIERLIGAPLILLELPPDAKKPELLPGESEIREAVRIPDGEDEFSEDDGS